METLFFSIAGLTIRMEYRDPRILAFCRDYLTDPTDAPAFSVAPDEAEMARAMAQTPGMTPLLAEMQSLHRAVAEQTPRFGALQFHGAAVAADGKAYLFTAPSGTGKSTHIRLWKEVYGDRVQIVNGDKPMIRMRDGTAEVCSTPWAGKEGWQKNTVVPLGGVCLLKRGRENRIRRVSPGEHLPFLMNQVYLPADGEALRATLTLLDQILTAAPCYELACDISPEAAKTSFEAMTGGGHV